MSSKDCSTKASSMHSTTASRIRSVSINIRKIREYRNYTQEYLALKLGITQNAYSKIELAYTKITLDRLFQIAEILEVDIEVILNKNSDEIILLNR